MARKTLDMQSESNSPHPANDAVSVEQNSPAIDVTGYKRRFEQVSNQDEYQHQLPSKRARPTNDIHQAHSVPDVMGDVQSDSNISGSTVAGEEIPDDKLEPIAIIGLSLRFPQDATSPAGFWDMLMEGRSARSDVPKNRFNVDAFYKAGSSKTGIVSLIQRIVYFSEQRANHLHS